MRNMFYQLSISHCKRVDKSDEQLETGRLIDPIPSLILLHTLWVSPTKERIISGQRSCTKKSFSYFLSFAKPLFKQVKGLEI